MISIHIFCPIWSLHLIRLKHDRPQQCHCEWVKKEIHSWQISYSLLLSTHRTTFTIQLAVNGTERSDSKVFKCDRCEESQVCEFCENHHVPPFSGTWSLTSSVTTCVCFTGLTISSISLWPFPTILDWFFISFCDTQVWHY
jgi:hypothetical protein